MNIIKKYCGEACFLVFSTTIWHVFHVFGDFDGMFFQEEIACFLKKCCRRPDIHTLEYEIKGGRFFLIDPPHPPSVIWTPPFIIILDLFLKMLIIHAIFGNILTSRKVFEHPCILIFKKFRCPPPRLFDTPPVYSILESFVYTKPRLRN